MPVWISTELYITQAFAWVFAVVEFGLVESIGSERKEPTTKRHLEMLRFGASSRLLALCELGLEAGYI